MSHALAENQQPGERGFPYLAILAHGIEGLEQFEIVESQLFGLRIHLPAQIPIVLNGIWIEIFEAGMGKDGEIVAFTLAVAVENDHVVIRAALVCGTDAPPCASRQPVLLEIDRLVARGALIHLHDDHHLALIFFSDDSGADVGVENSRATRSDVLLDFIRVSHSVNLVTAE